MDKLKMHTPNLADENFQKLAAMFPNAVTETINENGEVVRAIDADVLRQEISCSVVEGMQERYQFTWPDKKKSVVLANQPIAKTLRLDRSKSVGRDGTPGSIDTENIYIEGDNLDALKLLRETYLCKVKLIYIVIWSYMILIAVLLCYNRNSDYTDLRMPVKVKMHVSRPLTGILKSAETQISDRSKAVIVQSRSRLQIMVQTTLYFCTMIFA